MKKVLFLVIFSFIILLSGCELFDEVVDDTNLPDDLTTLTIIIEVGTEIDNLESYVEQFDFEYGEATYEDLNLDFSNVDLNTVNNYEFTYEYDDITLGLLEGSIIIQVVDTVNPSISLFGPSEVNYIIGSNYYDLGCSAIDTYDGELLCETNMEDVNLDVEGTYTIHYSAVDSSGNIGTASRTIIVLDTEVLTINIIGDSYIDIVVFTEYTDLGATCLDESNEICEVIVTGDVDTEMEGTYQITYSSTNNDGYIQTVIREVHVYDENVIDIDDVAVKNPNMANFLRVFDLNLDNQISRVEAAKLTNINISGELSDISYFQYFINLEVLFLNGNNISDISPLFELSKITEIYLNGNVISNIDGIANLENLVLLDLANNLIVDPSPLSGLTSLEMLSMGSNDFTDFSTVSNLPSILFITISNGELTNFGAVNRFPTLIKLDLSGNKIDNFYGLSELTELQELRLFNNQLTDISAFSELSDSIKLTYLEIGQNNISNICPLSTVISLLELHVATNHLISNISCLESLTNLKVLSFTNNQVSDISVFSNFSELTYLTIGGNPISDISILLDLDNLTFIYLEGIDISFEEGSLGMDIISQLEDKGVVVQY